MVPEQDANVDSGSDVVDDLEAGREQLNRSVEAFRDTLPEDFQPDFDNLVNEIRQARTSELQSEWTSRLQKAAELNKRFSGKDDALAMGEYMLALKERDPARFAEVQRQLAFGTPQVSGGGSGSPVPKANVADKTALGTHDGDEVLPTVKQMLAEVEQTGGDPLVAIDFLSKKRAEQMIKPIQEQLQNMSQALRNQSIQQAVSQLRQDEARYIAENPMMKQYVDEVRRRQNTEVLANGMGFWQLPIEQQFLMAAGPDLMTALAARERQQPHMPNRTTANVLGSPQQSSPAHRSPPKTVDEAWDRVAEEVSESAVPPQMFG